MAVVLTLGSLNCFPIIDQTFKPTKQTSYLLVMWAYDDEQQFSLFIIFVVFFVKLNCEIQNVFIWK